MLSCPETLKEPSVFLVKDGEPDLESFAASIFMNHCSPPGFDWYSSFMPNLSVLPPADEYDRGDDDDVTVCGEDDCR